MKIDLAKKTCVNKLRHTLVIPVIFNCCLRFCLPDNAKKGISNSQCWEGYF